MEDAAGGGAGAVLRLSMTYIKDSVERSIQEILAREKGKIVDGAVIYVIFGIFETIRYIDGDRHLTGGCNEEFIGEPWYYWYSTVARHLFAPKGVVVQFDAPVCWDNDIQPIPDNELQMIFARIRRIFGKRYKRCRFVVEPPRKVMEIE